MGKPHPPEKKAAALAALASGESVRAVAQRLGLSRTTVAMWRDAAGLNEPAAVVHEKRQALGEQVYELIEDSIRTLRVQLRVAADESWLKQQSAGELAVFHGVIADKTVRLLASLRPTSDDVEEAP